MRIRIAKKIANAEDSGRYSPGKVAAAYRRWDRALHRKSRWFRELIQRLPVEYRAQKLYESGWPAAAFRLLTQDVAASLKG